MREDQLVRLANDVALEAAMDLLFRQALFRSPDYAIPGARITSHSYHGDSQEGVVCLPLSAAIESMAARLSRRCFQGVTHLELRTFRAGRVESVSSIAPDKAGESAWSATVTLDSFHVEQQELNLDPRGEDVRCSSPRSDTFHRSQDCRSSWRVVLRRLGEDRFTLSQYHRGPCEWKERVAVRTFVRAPVPTQLDLVPRRDR